MKLDKKITYEEIGKTYGFTKGRTQQVVREEARKRLKRYNADPDKKPRRAQRQTLLKSIMARGLRKKL